MPLIDEQAQANNGEISFKIIEAVLMLTYINHFRRIRESEYVIKRVIEENLKQIPFDDELRKTGGGYSDYYHMWQATLSDKFYDMTTIVRLGTIIECCLKDYYQEKSGISNRKELQEHINSRQNVFQQVLPWDNEGILTRIKNQFKIDPLLIDELPILQEVMLLRHLYAHNSGLLDRKFVNNYERLTGIDICKSSSIFSESLKNVSSTFKFAEKSMYSDFEYEDTYFFEPLHKMSIFISGSERFFDRLYKL